MEIQAVSVYAGKVWNGRIRALSADRNDDRDSAFQLPLPAFFISGRLAAACIYVLSDYVEEYF